LMGLEDHANGAEAWMAELQQFLEEDRCLVESAQRGYASGLQPGPAHRLEQRILQWQALYASWMELDRLKPESLTTAAGAATTPPWPH
jgi:hypothetical protein